VVTSLVKTLPRRRAVRREPRQERARQTVEAVLDAVTIILRRDGVDAVTTNRVAEVAGVSIGSVYQYFTDKHAIFRALHERHAEAMGRVVERAVVEGASSSPDDILRALVGALIAAHAADPAVHGLSSLGVPHRAGDAWSLDAHLVGALRRVLSPGAEGRDLEREIFVLAHMVEALAHGAVLGRPPRLSLADAGEEAVRAVLAYLHGANVSAHP
jgi:AcrR family transcriptional regulator